MLLWLFSVLGIVVDDAVIAVVIAVVVAVAAVPLLFELSRSNFSKERKGSRSSYEAAAISAGA